MKRLRVNIDLIKEFIDTNELSALALYYKMKATFTNSTFYFSYNSYKELGQKFHISIPTVKKHIHTLKKRNLLLESSKSITARSLKGTEFKIRKRNSVNLYFKDTDSINDIKYKLMFALVKHNALQQLFMIDLKKQYHSEKGKINLKHYKKFLAKKGENAKQLNTKMQLSNQSIGEMLNCSVQQVSYIKNIWEQMEIIKFKREFKRLGKVNRKQFGVNQDLFGKKCFVSKLGRLYQSECSSFKLLDTVQWDSFQALKAHGLGQAACVRPAA